MNFALFDFLMIRQIRAKSFGLKSIEHRQLAFDLIQFFVLQIQQNDETTPPMMMAHQDCQILSTYWGGRSRAGSSQFVLSGISTLLLCYYSKTLIVKFTSNTECPQTLARFKSFVNSGNMMNKVFQITDKYISNQQC